MLTKPALRVVCLAGQDLGGASGGSRETLRTWKGAGGHDPTQGRQSIWFKNK